LSEEMMSAMDRPSLRSLSPNYRIGRAAETCGPITPS
jgi:hypothetical protein